MDRRSRDAKTKTHIYLNIASQLPTTTIGIDPSPVGATCLFVMRTALLVSVLTTSECAPITFSMFTTVIKFAW
jgi:hypothetical protein